MPSRTLAPVAQTGVSRHSKLKGQRNDGLRLCNSILSLPLGLRSMNQQHVSRRSLSPLRSNTGLSLRFCAVWDMVRARGVGSFAHVGRDVSKASWSHDWYSLACKHLELEFAKGGGGGTVSLNGMPTMLRRDVIDAEGTVPIQHRQVVSLGL